MMEVVFSFHQNFPKRKTKKRKCFPWQVWVKIKGGFSVGFQGLQPLAQPLIFNGAVAIREPAYLA
jgi:hypothetical protein